MVSPPDLTRLQDQLAQTCDLTREAIAVGSRNVELFRPTDPDTLLDAMLAKPDDDLDVRDERLPYWAELWPSSIALSRHLTLSGTLSRSDHVLELGCGLGLVGIVAGYHSQSVVLTDYDPTALRFAELNWRAHHDTPFRGEVMDWREPRVELAADVVLAADVAYESRALVPLVHAFRTLTRPGGRIFVAEPGRRVAHGFAAEIARQLTCHHRVAQMSVVRGNPTEETGVLIHEFSFSGVGS